MLPNKAGVKMIDWSRIDELRSDFGEEDFGEIVGMFLTEVQGKLDEMSKDPTSCQADDFHFLKGSAANLGFRKLQAACAAAEQDQSATSVAEINTLFQRSKQTFLDQINDKTRVA